MSEQALKLLLLEDETSFAGAVRACLDSGETHPPILAHERQLGQALNRIEKEVFDLVLLDLNVPDAQGLDTYRAMRQATGETPIIVLTGMTDQNLALQAVREGAQDYLVKGEVDTTMLKRSIGYAIERARVGEALRESEEFFRLISEAVRDAIMVVDPQGQRLYCSPSCQQLLGKLTGSDWLERVHPEDRGQMREILAEILATGTSQRIQYRVQPTNGLLRHFEAQASLIRDASGRPAKVVLVARDITEHKDSVAVLRAALSDLKQSNEQLKATQRQLIQAERLEAISTFAAGVAHEVKSPLQTILLGLDYLRNHLLQRGEPVTEVLHEMGDAVRRADAILMGLLKSPAGHRKQDRDEEFNAIVHQALQTMDGELSNYPVTVHTSLAPDLPAVHVDCRTLKHVWINLILYALEGGVEEGGRLALRTGSRLWIEGDLVNGNPVLHFQAGQPIVVGEVEYAPPALRDGVTPSVPFPNGNSLGLMVLKGILASCGAVLDYFAPQPGGRLFRMFLKPAPTQGRD